MKLRHLIALPILLGFSGCAVVNSPIRLAEEAASATIRTGERTTELGLEILDEPFEDDPKLTRRELRRLEQLERNRRQN